MKLAPPFVESLPRPESAAVEAIALRVTQQYGAAHTDDDRVAYRLISAYHNQTQSHTTSGAFEAVSFNSEDDLRGVRGIDVPVGVHSKTVTTQRFMTPGDRNGSQRYVRGRARVVFAANATGDRGLRVMVNDAIARRPSFHRAATAGGNTRVTAAFGLVVSPGDAIHIEAYQDSGGALTLGSTDRADANEIELEWL